LIEGFTFILEERTWMRTPNFDALEEMWKDWQAPRERFLTWDIG
jgi:hypothetical protein